MPGARDPTMLRRLFGPLRWALGAGRVLMVLVTLPVDATAVTIMECRDADGSLSYRDACPPDSTRIGIKRLGGSSAPQRSSLEEIAKAHPVVLYVVTDCESCDLVRLMLDKRGIPYAERDVERDVSLQHQLRELSGAARVPTVLIGGEALPGFDRILLQQRLSEAGYPMESVPAGR